LLYFRFTCLFSGVFIVSLALTIWVYLKTKQGLLDLPNIFIKGLSLVAYGILLAASVFVLSKIKLNSSNIFQSEISANGLVKFYDAFNNKVLDFDVFYPTMDTQKAINEELSRLHTDRLPRMIKSDSAEITKNVVLISVESLSAEFMAMYGNKDNVTPFLDSLSKESLIFPNTFANGRQSIHGMSSVLAGIPSLKDAFTSSPYSNQKIQSIVSVANELGYETSFYHGAPNGSMGFQGFANILGFKDYFGKTEYNNDKDFDGIWAIWDEPFLQYFARSLKNNSISKDSFAKFSSSFIISYSFSFNILFKNIFILELGVIPSVSSAIFKSISLPFAVTISLSKIEIESLILPEEFS